MELKEPQSKKRPRGCSRPIPRHPLPILTEGIITKTNMWICTGQYTGDGVVVNKRDEMSRLNSQGYFGKGSLSRSFPVFDKVDKGIPPFIRERQWKRRCSWALVKTGLDASEESSSLSRRSAGPCLDSQTIKPEANNCQNQATTCDINSLEIDGCNVVVLNNSDSECEDGSFLNNLQPHIEHAPSSIGEVLHLTFEEAFFLSYALGCLRIFDLLGNKLSIGSTWSLFLESQEDFAELYVVYHYFRAKGWVVKPGLKFGGDFLLYKQGPAFYHASYIVKVQVLNWYCSNSRTTQKCLPSWKNVMGLSRLAETAAKELLICQVVWPTGYSEDALKSPSIISKFTVNEMLVKRWVAAQERDHGCFLNATEEK